MSKDHSITDTHGTSKNMTTSRYLEYARADTLGPIDFRGKTYTIPVVNTSKNGHSYMLFRAMDLAAALTGVDIEDARRKFQVVQDKVASLKPNKKLMDVLDNGVSPSRTLLVHLSYTSSTPLVHFLYTILI